MYVTAPEGRQIDALSPLRGLFCSEITPSACALG